jgi:hypothetical protein
MRLCPGFIVLSLLASLALGCGKSEVRPPTYEVRGMVLYQDKPVNRAFIVLHPVDASVKNVPPPTAYTDRDGKFTLGTWRADDGVPAGEYLVTISCIRKTRPDEDEEEEEKNLLPERYLKPETSNLRITITVGTNELPAFRLTP